MDGLRIVLNVPAAGEHEISLWMREDGMAVERILLTADAAFNPSTNTTAALTTDGARETTNEEEVSSPELEYALAAAYPNPFSSSTTIEYAIPEPIDVSVVAYDLLGRQVRVLAEGPQEAGRYEVRLDAAELASGVYVIVMRAGSFQQTRRVVLVK